ncbi:hypothetical protein [Allosphingosinicella humi]
MRRMLLAVLMAGTVALGACANPEEEVIETPPPAGVGAIAGTVAADRNGDGLVDGYYTSDGMYHAFEAPPCPPPPPPPPPPMPSGERG